MAKSVKVAAVALLSLTYLTRGELQRQQSEQAVNTSHGFLRGASTTSSNETHFGSNATLAASIVGGKIKLGDTGLCLAHEDNWVSTNRVKAVACYDNSHVLWTINGDQIKSYQDASCLDWHAYFISNPRVNMYKCYDGGYFSNPDTQKWRFTGHKGLIKSVVKQNTECLEYKHDGYVHLEPCDETNTNQLWELEQR